MQSFLLLSLSLLSLLSLRVGAAVPEVAMSPLALNAFLNSTVSFTCSGRGSGPSLLFTTISWRVNGAVVNTSEGIYHVEFNTTNKSLAYSTLSFTASPEFNNTSVLCTVSTVGWTPPDYILEHADAPLAHLKLQGLLSPLSNLSLQYGRTLTFLSWLPPFSLDGLDIRYAVSLSNESHAFSFSLVNVNGFNISSMKYLSSCSVYNFTVQPLNNVGVSTATSIVQFFPGVPVTPPISSITIDDIISDQADRDIEAVLHFPMTTGCFTDQNITSLIKTPSNHYQSVLTLPNDNNTTVVLSILGLPPNELLTLELTLSNQLGSSSVGGIVINTYDVQTVDIINSTEEGVACFQCTLLTNSTAQGCRLILSPVTGSQGHCSLSQSSSELSIFMISEDSQSFTGCISGLYTGTYRVSAYDIESDESFSARGLVLEEVTLKGMACPLPTAAMTTSTAGSVTPSNGLNTVTTSTSFVPTPTGVNDSATVARTAGILIGVFGAVILLAVSVLIGVFVYNRCHSKGGVLTITADRGESVPVRSERVHGGTARSSTVNTDSPELTAVHPSYTPVIRSEYSPQPVATEAVTMEMTLQDNEEEEEEQKIKPPSNKRQFLVVQSSKLPSNSVSSSTGGVRDSRASSSSSGSESFPPLRYTRFGSGEYDHLTGDSYKEVTVPVSSGGAAVQLDSIVIDSNPQYSQSEVL